MSTPDVAMKLKDGKILYDDLRSKSEALTAPVFCETEAYPTGKIVIYEGALYELPDGHTANTTWENTTKTQTNVSNEVSQVKSALLLEQKKTTLEDEDIPNTTQTITFDSSGNVSSIVHTDGNGNTVRTDAFTFGNNSITEVRTLSTGETLTIVTDTTTLKTTVTYVAA